MKKILLIGGSGYIGSVIINDSIKKDYLIKSLDFNIYNDQKELKLADNKKLEFIKFDIRNTNLIDKFLKDIDCIVILAGLVGEFITKKYPKLSKEINEDAIINLIDTLDKFENIQNLIFVSTCSNYGITNDDALVNEDYVLNPLSPYAKAKVKVENYLLRKKKVSYASTILRFATAFGLSPRMRFDLTVNHFCYSMVKDKKIEVFDPETWRPYCHVKDFSRLIFKVLDLDTKLVKNKIFNAGSDKNNFTKEGIVNLIKKRIPDANVLFKKDGVDKRDYRVSFSRVENELGFNAKYNVDYGIDEILDMLNKDNKFLKEDALKYRGNFDILSVID